MGYVEPGEAFCYFLRIVSPTGCLVLPLSVTLPSSFLLFSEMVGDYVLSGVIQDEAGGLSKT